MFYLIIEVQSNASVWTTRARQGCGLQWSRRPPETDTSIALRAMHRIFDSAEEATRRIFDRSVRQRGWPRTTAQEYRRGLARSVLVLQSVDGEQIQCTLRSGDRVIVSASESKHMRRDSCEHAALSQLSTELENKEEANLVATLTMRAGGVCVERNIIGRHGTLFVIFGLGENGALYVATVGTLDEKRIRWSRHFSRGAIAVDIS